MDLIDFFGNAFGGGQQNDPINTQLAAQLGADPEALRRQAAMQGLGQLGAAMLANSAPSTQRKSLASIVGQGLQAAQSGFDNSVNSRLNRLYVLENLKRAGAADQRQASADAQDAQWRARFDNPDFVSTLPKAVQPYSAILRGMPVNQAASFILQAQQAEEAAAERKDQRAQPKFMSGPNGAIYSIDPTTSAAQQIVAGKAAAGPAAPQAPWWMAALPPDQRAAAIQHAAGLDTSNARVPASVMARTAHDAEQLQTSLPSIENMQDNLGRAEQLIRAGTDTGMIASWKANTNPAWLDKNQQELLSLVKDSVVGQARALPGSFSNKEGMMVELSRFNLGNTPEANLAILNRVRSNLDRMKSEGYKRLDHYQAGGTVLDYKPSESAAGVQAGAATTAPPAAEAPPPTWQKMPDGRYRDPATGKIYRWQPGG